MSNQPQLIEPISILTNSILSFLEEKKINTNLTNITFEKIYQLTLLDLTKNIMRISDKQIIGLRSESNNIEILYQYAIGNIEHLGFAIKQFALNLAEFLKTEDYKQIHPLYIELTEMGEKLIQENKILNSNELNFLNPNL
jgi:hypothetical protein